MPARSVYAVLMLCCLIEGGQAQSLSTASLPAFARNPQAFTQNLSVWNGLQEGQQFYSFTTSGMGRLSGSGTFSGFSQKFSNNVFVDVRAGSGYAPSIFQSNPVSGFDYASTQLKIGYDLGRLRPYVIGSFGAVNPVLSNGLNIPGGPANTMLNQTAGGTRSFTSVGAGFDYAISNKLSVGVGVSVGATRGMLSPLAPAGLQ